MPNRHLSPIDRYRRAIDPARNDAVHPQGLQDGSGRDDERIDRTFAYHLLVGVATLALAGVVLFGVPVGGQERDLRVVGGGLVVVGLCVWKAFIFYREARPGRLRLATPALGVALVMLMLLGGMTQLVIDGRPQLATSREARAHEMVRDIYDDLLEMGVHDELLSMTQADARSRYNSYEPAARAMRVIANRWSRVDLGELPDPDLIEIVGHVKTAATFGAEALDLRYILITEPDDRTEAIVRENRAAFVAETLAAGAKLKPLAERYLVSITPPGGGE